MNALTTTRWLRTFALPPQFAQQVRHRSWFGLGSTDKDDPKLQPTTKPPTPSPPPSTALDLSIIPGDLANNPLFDADDTGPSSGDYGYHTYDPTPGAPRLSSIDAFIRDPNRHKWTWPLRYDARMHRRRGRLSHAEQILQTEPAHTAKSHFIKTSLKKLGPLARQIAGKNIEDAIVQMRFSAKKASGEVMGHLKQARDEALLRRGMKPGKTYVEQAWVGRGAYGMKLSHRAKGRIDRLRLPYTSITVVLKTDATKVRIAKAKEAKELRKRPFLHHPNRPIYGQTQYYRW